MPTIQLDADNNVVTYDATDGNAGEHAESDGAIADPSTYSGPGSELEWTDEQLDAAVQFTNGVNSPEQYEIDSLRAREKFCVDKANVIASYDPATGKPIYEVGDIERDRLLKTAANIRASLPDQLILLQRSLARRFLDKQRETAANQTTLATYAALEQKAREIAFNDQAQEMADAMRKRTIGGTPR